MVKSQIKEALLNKGTFNNKLTDYGVDLFRSVIYGDYSENDYLRAKSMQIVTNRKKLRSYVIETFCKAVSTEFNCSYGYAQKCMVNLFGLQSLDSINDELIDELKNLDK